jgi:hypothetical protein
MTRRAKSRTAHSINKNPIQASFDVHIPANKILGCYKYHARLHGVRVVQRISNCSEFITIHWKYGNLVAVSGDQYNSTYYGEAKFFSTCMELKLEWYNSNKDQTGDSTLMMRRKKKTVGKLVEILNYWAGSYSFFLSKRWIGNPRKMRTQWHWNLATK